jgi:hypothetical protein
MEIHRIGSFPNLPLDSAPVAEGETAAKGARRAEPALKPEDPAPVAGNESTSQPVELRQAESRLNAESLKARLFARCDPSSSDRTIPSPPAGAESSAAAEIMDYFRRNPEATDSLEGIDGWKDFGEMAQLDAQANVIAIEHLVIQAEGWTRDDSATEPAGSADGTDGQAVRDDPGRD